MDINEAKCAFVTHEHFRKSPLRKSVFSSEENLPQLLFQQGLFVADGAGLGAILLVTGHGKTWQLIFLASYLSLKNKGTNLSKGQSDLKKNGTHERLRLYLILLSRIGVVCRL